MKLNPLIDPDLIKTDCANRNTEDVLKEIITHLKMKNKITNDKLILRKLIERERLGSTSIGNHAAVPHTKIKGLKEPILFIAISKEGIRYHENDKELVHLILLILSPNDTPILHLQILAAAASFIKKSNNLRREILEVNSTEDVIHLIEKYERSNDEK